MASFSIQDVMAILPHRAPFLFVDRVIALEPYKAIVAERLMRADEPQFAGHFPGEPMMPGVLVSEALAQTSGLLMGLSDKVSGKPAPKQRIMYLLAATNVKYKQPARPGDTLILRAASDKSLSGLYQFSVEARVGEKIVASGTLMLALQEGNEAANFKFQASEKL